MAGRTARWQVDEEQDWPLTAPHGRPRPRVLQGFPGTPRCEGALSSDPCAHLSLPRAICCILEIWMDYYQEDFCRLPQSASLKKILEFIRQRMPGTDVELRARRYLQQLRRLHAAEPEAGGEEAWGWPSWGQGGPHGSSVRAAGPGAGVRLTPHPHELQAVDTSQGSLSGWKSVLDLGGTWKVRPGGDTLSSWSYSFGPSKRPLSTSGARPSPNCGACCLGWA